MLPKIEKWWRGESAPHYFSFSPHTGEFMGFGEQDPSPLEPGVWLLPGCSTSAQPPAYETGYVPVWDGESWAVKEDHRGEVTYVDGEFRAIASIGSLDELGLRPLQVHDAKYKVPDNDDQDGVLIRMWVNDDIILFVDDPNLIQRQVLAAWEAQGGVIRPVNEGETAPEPTGTPSISPEEDALRRLDELRQDMDKLAQQGVEGIPVPQEEP